MEMTGESFSSTWRPVHATHIQPSQPLMRLQTVDYEPIDHPQSSLAPVPWPPAAPGSFSFRQNNISPDANRTGGPTHVALSDPCLMRFLRKQTVAEMIKDMETKTTYLLSRIQSPAQIHMQRVDFARQEEEARFYAELNVNTLAEAFPDSTYASDSSTDSEAEKEELDAEAKELKDEEQMLRRGEIDMRSLFEFDLPLKGVRLDDERMKNKAERSRRRRSEKAERKKLTKWPQRRVTDSERHSLDNPRSHDSRFVGQRAASPKVSVVTTQPLKVKTRSHSDSQERPRSWLRRDLTSMPNPKTPPLSAQGSPSTVYDIYSPWPTVYQASSPTSVPARELDGGSKQRPSGRSTVTESAIVDATESTSTPCGSSPTEPLTHSNSGQPPHHESQQPQDKPVPHQLLTLTTQPFTNLIASLTSQWALTAHACTALAAHALDQQRHMAEIARRLADMEQRYMDKVSELGEVRRELTVRDCGGAGGRLDNTAKAHEQERNISQRENG